MNDWQLLGLSAAHPISVDEAKDIAIRMVDDLNHSRADEWTACLRGSG
jgi:hypothetical protein